MKYIVYDIAFVSGVIIPKSVYFIFIYVPGRVLGIKPHSRRRRRRNNNIYDSIGRKENHKK